ncbi:MAG: DUF1178 family protein [Thermodesulfobacteriota bacterium]
MIVFDLACACGFQFEGWFRDHEDFTAQGRAGLLQCPECGGAAIRKILSPVVSVRSGGEKGERLAAALPTPEAAGLAVKLLRAMHQLVETHCEDVGHKLAQEALKIHYGDAEPRNLRGQATPEEEQVLEREGIELLKLPVLPPEEDGIPQ